MIFCLILFFFFFSSRRRHTRFDCDWSSDVCSSDLHWITRGTAGRRVSIFCDQEERFPVRPGTECPQYCASSARSLARWHRGMEGGTGTRDGQRHLSLLWQKVSHRTNAERPDLRAQRLSSFSRRVRSGRRRAPSLFFGNAFAQWMEEFPTPRTKARRRLAQFLKHESVYQSRGPGRTGG